MRSVGHTSALEPGWRLTFWLLLACQAGISLIYGMLSPLLSLYLGELGLGDSDLIQFWAGVSGAATGVTATLGGPFWGLLADRYGKRPLLLRSAIGLVVVLAGFALSQSVAQFVWFRFLQGVLIGFQPAALALVVERAPREQTAWVVGLFQTAGVAGTVAGPALGTGLAHTFGAIRPTFWVLAAIAAAISTAVLVQVRDAPSAREGRTEPISIGAVLDPLREQPRLIGLLAVIAISGFGQSALDTLLPLYIPTLDLGGRESLFFTGVVFSASGVATVIAASGWGRVANVYGPRRILALCLGAGGVFFALQGAVQTGWQLTVVRFLLGLCMGGLLPVASAAISAALPASRQGRGFGLSYSASFLGSVLGPLAGGVVGTALGLPPFFFLSAALMAGACFWLALTQGVIVKREQHG